MSFVNSVLFRIPLLGWFIKDAEQGSDTDKILFFLNLVALVVLSVYFFGYSALITTGLIVVPIMFLILITITATDAFSKQGAED